MGRALLATLPALGIALVALDAQAWCQMTSSSARPTPGQPCITDGVPLAWTRSCISYAIDAGGTRFLTREQLQGVARRSFGAWLEVTCDGVPNDFQVGELSEPSECIEAEFRTGKGNVNTIAFLDDFRARDYDVTAFALTTVWHNTRTGEILDADMQINESLGPYAICPNDGCPVGADGVAVSVDLQNVMTHEAGHFFGVAHSQFPTATMTSTSLRGETAKRTLRVDDRDGFCAIYPPGSLPDECSFEPRGGLDLTCPDGGCCSVAGGDRRRRPEGLAGAALLALVMVRRRRRRRGKLGD